MKFDEILMLVVAVIVIAHVIWWFFQWAAGNNKHAPNKEYCFDQDRTAAESKEQSRRIERVDSTRLREARRPQPSQTASDERATHWKDQQSRIQHTPPAIVAESIRQYSRGTGSARFAKFGLERSPLKVFGYKVGKHGLTLTERRQVLEFAVFGVIPNFFAEEYRAEWGEPGTPKRYEAILSHLHMLQSTRRQQLQMKQAIADWNMDYRWLVESYADLMRGYRKYLL